MKRGGINCVKEVPDHGLIPVLDPAHYGHAHHSRGLGAVPEVAAALRDEASVALLH